MGWDGIDSLKELMKEKGIVERERTPIEVQLVAVYDYLRGLSPRRVRDGMSKYKRSHVAIGEWVKRFGSVLKGSNRYAGEELPDTLVVDETELQIGHRSHYLWVALDPERPGIWYVAMIDVRNLLIAAWMRRKTRTTLGRRQRVLLQQRQTSHVAGQRSTDTT